MAEYLPGTTGDRITELREGAGLTMEKLAAKIGVNATTLGRMETRKSILRPKSRKRKRVEHGNQFLEIGIRF